MASMNRRDLVAATVAAILSASRAVALAGPQGQASGEGGMAGGMAMLLYPGMTALDVVGPQVLLSGLVRGGTALVAEAIGPVESDTGLKLLASHDFASCPSDVQVLFVPGGDGTPAQMRDEATLAFLRDRAARAQWVTSVCTGSLILGAAGLLQGYRATSHWCVRDLLPLLGAEPIESRVVFDRNRVTAAGVSAGLDFALALGAKLSGETDAETAQLVAEYAPLPPFRAGTPEAAGPEVTRAAQAILAELVAESREAALAKR